jgi:hypothetical protein
LNGDGDRAGNEEDRDSTVIKGAGVAGVLRVERFGKDRRSPCAAETESGATGMTSAELGTIVGSKGIIDEGVSRELGNAGAGFEPWKFSLRCSCD